MTRSLLDALRPDTDDRHLARQASAAVLARNPPMLHLEDVSGIPFVDGIAGVEQYQHRARVRAHDRDLFASTTPAAPGYEAYCRDLLQMGAVRELLATPLAGFPTRVARACMSGEVFAQLCDVAREAGELVIHPYMGVEDVWALAAQLEQEAGVPVYVLAPTPVSLWVANDKAQLDRVAREIGLHDDVVETEIACTPATITAALGALAQRHERVALKRTRCASAMGNQVYDSARLRALSNEALEARVREFLRRTECAEGEEVLAVEWIDAVSSPSSQLWIPSLRDADLSVSVDGFYEQLLVGEERMFLGSRPSRLGAEIEGEMARISLAMAEAFRTLGYVGRCSFDFVVDRHGVVKMTECNGRWGGTSTPMYLVDRLVAGDRPAYVAQDFVHPQLVGMSFPEVLERVGEECFDPRTQQGRFIFYNVGPLAQKGKLDVIALGESAEEAMHAVSERLPELLGLETTP